MERGLDVDGKGSDGKNMDGKNPSRVTAHSVPDWHVAPDRETLAEQVARATLARLRTAIEVDGMASLVVSGGSTPVPLFARLSQADLDWGRVSITLADERWVPTDDTASNEKLIRETLLVERAASATFVSLYREGQSPAEALADIEAAVAAIPRPFSVVILGMGADGHTASLFPDAPDVQQALATQNDANVAIMKPASQPQTRITLTRAALLDSAQRILHITGVDKRMVLEGALADTLADSTGQLLPIARFFDRDTGAPSVYWSE